MKHIVKILAATSAVLLASTALAEADPITAAITAFAGWLGSGGIGALIVKTLLGIAVKLGLSLLQQAQNKPKTQGVKFEVEIGDDAPIGFPVGKYATSGTRKFTNTYGRVGKTPNAYLVDVVQFSDLPCQGIDGLWVNGEKVTLLTAEAHADLGIPIQEYRKDGTDYLWVKVKDGTQAVADPYLLATFSAHATMPWLSDMIGIGCAYLIVTARFNSELHRSGAPQLLIEPKPTVFYDIRKDTTAGGSGAHRWTDRSTWEPTVNNVVVAYNLLRGVYYGDEWLFGGQDFAASRLPASNWMAGMNACDLTTPVGASSEPIFRCGYEVRGDMEPLAVAEELLKGCNGRITEVGGRFKVLVGAPGAAVYSFTDENVVVTREQGWRPFPGMSETVNAIEATYPEPGEMWAQRDAPGLYSDVLEAEDKGFRLPEPVQFNAVPYANQVQRLMLAMREDARRFRIHTLYLPPDAWVLEPLDVVSWTSARNGYSNKKFLVMRADGEPGMNQAVVLKEIDPADYDPPDTYVPVVPEPPGPNVPPTQVDPIFDADGIAIPDGTGRPRRPAIQITFAGDLDDVRALQVQVRLQGETDTIYDYDIPYGVAGADDSVRQMILNGTFLPAEDYEVRAKLVPASRRAAAWMGWIAVTTPDTPFDLPDLGPDVRDWQDWIGRGTRELLDELRALAAQVSSQDLGNFADKQVLRRELKSRTDEVTASYSEAIIAATGPGSALVARLEILEATIPDLATATALSLLTTRVTTAEGLITSQAAALIAVDARLTTAEGDIAAQASAAIALTTRVTDAEGDIIAVANAVIAVESTIDDVTASANFRAETYAGPAGYSSRIGLEARVGGAGIYRSASLFLDVPASTSTPTRVVVVADQFAVANAAGSTLQVPFLVSGGIVYMQNVRIGTAVIDDGAITSTKTMDLIVT